MMEMEELEILNLMEDFVFVCVCGGGGGGGGGGGRKHR